MAQLSARMASGLYRLVLRGLPSGLFGRLLLLLMLTMVVSRVLAATLVSGLPPLTAWGEPGAALAASPQTGLVHLGWLLDAVALVMAAWLGARWTRVPLRKLNVAAKAIGGCMRRAPLLEEGALECREATRMFNQMQARIRQQMLQRDQFVAAVSHDLRTPLNRLARRAQALSDPQQRQRFDKDIGEMHEMIRTTLDTLRGLAEPEPMVQIDVATLLRSLAEDARDSAQDVQLVGELACAPVLAQASALRRCVSNLIGNALRYGQYARISLLDKGDQLQISVHDNGPGIPEAAFNKVLTPFYQLASTQPCHRGGVGLGLATASDIARRHGGALTLANHPEGGLVATLSLPRQLDRVSKADAVTRFGSIGHPPAD
ncbi:ATP-binding protein [Rhodoferax sp. U11-2br]|uniref:ATP-binding protein n=1 Tax=Rhodoferax sp. U11-2br TaxID=2838878 RepID=UPI001BE863FF|nr:ATP-binding protein [Rhodoferax sp. U11-2br]MBT3065870.1 two-component sensor histidine kinase [Rhodoferax sp. U11-2br]